MQYNEPTTEKNHFPILVQLGLLALLMIGLFGSVMWQHLPTLASTHEPAQVVPQFDDRNHQYMSATLTDIPLTATAAYVYDITTGDVLYSKNSDDVLPLASLTKLMTTLVAHELVGQGTTVSVPVAAIQQEGDAGLMPGEQLSQKQLQQMALIASSNDAAYTLAASVGSLLGDQDAASQYVLGMNIRAQELGLSSLQFTNATGLDVSDTQPGALGSARDIAHLMAHILTTHPQLLQQTTSETARIYNTSGAYHDIENTNEVISQIPNLIGSKTGYTDLAGGNLTIAFDAAHNRPIIITVLGSTRSDRFDDVLRLVRATEAAVTSSN